MQNVPNMPTFSSRLLWACCFLGALSACPGTGSSGSDERETPLLLLAPEYAVDVRLLGFECPLGQFSPMGTRGVAEVSQTGNDVVWTQFALTSAGEVDRGRFWTMAGRICVEDGAPVLRLRGGRVARVAEGEVFCRADLRAPAGHAICPVSPDTCADPNTIRLFLDPCSDRLVGAFRSCMIFSEACLGQEACRFSMQWDAVASNAVNVPAGDDADACLPLEVPAPPNGCVDECRQCGC